MNESLPMVSRQALLSYFERGALPRERWQVGMEIEKMGRDAATGRPLPYEGTHPSVRDVLEFARERRRADPIYEGDHLVGLDGLWGTLSLEPGGQVEWSSRPAPTLARLSLELTEHLDLMREAGAALGVLWLPVGLDPVHSVADMYWMPKARYSIMREYLGKRGRLAHRMMTQTSSIQCAFDYADPEDWKRKFRAAALLTPVVMALFSNSETLEGKSSGYRSFRQVIWQETDPDRCGMPAVVFDPAFDMERWLDWVLDVPTIFRHRARGLVPTGGVPFRKLMECTGCEALKREDWETHASTIFTEVRSYTYIEVRSADLQPDALAFAVPTLWTGLLYDDDALGEALELGAQFDDAGAWREAMTIAARDGIDGKIGATDLRDLARRVLQASACGIARGAACTVRPSAEAEPLHTLASRLGIDFA